MVGRIETKQILLFISISKMRFLQWVMSVSEIVNFSPAGRRGLGSHFGNGKRGGATGKTHRMLRGVIFIKFVVLLHRF